MMFAQLLNTAARLGPKLFCAVLAFLAVQVTAFSALTTTAQAKEVFAGETTSGARQITCVIVTAACDEFTTLNQPVEGELAVSIGAGTPSRLQIQIRFHPTSGILEGGDPSTYILTNYTGETASPGRAIGLKGYRDTIPSSGASSTFSTTISINGVDHTITIADITKTDGAGVTPITFGAVTITGGAFGAAATIVNTGSQSASQVATGSNVMFQGASQNISTGIGNAIAERFFGGDGTQGAFSQDGSSLSAYVSVLGLGQAAQDRRAARLAMYDAPEALQAIEAATSGADAATADDGDEVSPYLLGMSDVPLAGAGPDVIRLNAWVRGTFTHYDGDAFSGDTWNGVAGVDYLATDDVLIGVMGGYERGDFDFDTTDGAFEGAGYTAGVYVGARLSDSIVADAFLTHSWLDYDTQAGTATGSTDASRWLVSLNVAGQYDIADGVTLEPNVRVFYAHETQDGYTLSDATVVAANSIDSGRLSLGPRLRFLVAEDWTASVSAHGEYDLSSEDQTDTTLPDFDGLLSARLGLGLDGTFANGWTLSLSGDVSGIGSGDFLAYTGTGKIRIPLY